MVRWKVRQISIQMCHASIVGDGGITTMSVNDQDYASSVRLIVMWGESALSGKNLWLQHSIWVVQLKV
jgi:hypothetical protein